VVLTLSTYTFKEGSWGKKGAFLAEILVIDSVESDNEDLRLKSC
jgi:hypothetical protein